MINKVIIVNPFGIGDVLFSTPLLKAIKRKFPACHITYVCNRRTEGMLKNHADISSIYVFEKDEYRALWEESKLKCLKKTYSFVKKIASDKYDILIDMSLGYIYSLALSIFAGIPVRIGFNYRKRGRFLTHKVDIGSFDSKHVIEYYLGLGSALGLDTSGKEMNLTVSREDSAWAEKFLKENGISSGDKVFGVIPGCGASWGQDAKYRRWSAWKFAEVADYISKNHRYKVLIFGDQKEIPICEKVISEMKDKESAVPACGKTTLGQFAALLDKCDIVVTNDGGPLHMAIALKKKTISIFGPVDENVYGPYPPSQRYIIIKSNEPCRPCYKSFKYIKCETLNCLKNIKTGDVIKAVEALIGQK